MYQTGSWKLGIGANPTSNKHKPDPTNILCFLDQAGHISRSGKKRAWSSACKRQMVLDNVHAHKRLPMQAYVSTGTHEAGLEALASASALDILYLVWQRNG